MNVFKRLRASPSSSATSASASRWSRRCWPRRSSRRSPSTSVRRCARRPEDAGSEYIERPLHIGTLRIRLLTGKVLVENLTIDGLHPRRSAVLHGEADRRRARLGARLQPAARHHHQLGRDDRLADAGREMGRRATISRASTTTTASRQGPKRMTTTLQVAARVSRPVHLRRSRDAVERRSAATSTSTSPTCRTITARRRSTAAPSRSRTSCRCGRT